MLTLDFRGYNGIDLIPDTVLENDAGTTDMIIKAGLS
jgi:hypothetical protein